ncbi:MAG: DUF4157 domain-containing protein [Acidobacteriota bacterium]
MSKRKRMRAADRVSSDRATANEPATFATDRSREARPALDHTKRHDDERPAPNRTGLPSSLLARAEGFFRHDFSTIRVHRNSRRPEEIGAIAFAEGEDLHFSPGAFDPHRIAGERLLGHELAHVVQQREGGLPRLKQDRHGVLDDTRSELEANERADAFTRNTSISPLHGEAADRANMPISVASPIIQPMKAGLRPIRHNDFRKPDADYNFGNTNTSTTTPDAGGSFVPSKFNPLNLERASGIQNLELNSGDDTLQVSDYDDSGLLSRTAATNLAPEVDHIVRASDDGANDPYNARILSKRQNSANTDADNNRPTADQREIAVYARIRFLPAGARLGYRIDASAALDQDDADNIYLSPEGGEFDGAPDVTTANGQTRILQHLRRDISATQFTLVEDDEVEQMEESDENDDDGDSEVDDDVVVD